MKIDFNFLFYFQGVSSALYDAGFFVNYPLAQLANMLDSKPILNISVYDYFWGYEDSLVRLASGIVPNFIDFEKFGLLDRVSMEILKHKYLLLINCQKLNNINVKL